MKFWDDILNGGLDRDFDGDIDSDDRDLWDMETAMEHERAVDAEIACQQQESWRDHYMDELDEYGIDPDDYDDEDEFLEALEERRIQADLDGYFESSNNQQEENEEGEDEEEYEEHEENSISIPLKLHFSVEVKESEQKKERKNGILKYFSSYMDEENYAQALIDNFPELAKDYGPSLTCGTLNDIIEDTLEIDLDRAIKYVKWLWDNFTPDLFANEEEKYDEERPSYLLRGKLIDGWVYWHRNSKTLYNLIKKDDTIFNAGFRDCVHPIHNYSLVLEYMRFMLKHNDVGEIKRGYAGYLHWQKGRYTDNDLGKMWKNFVDTLKHNFYGMDEEGGLSNEEKFAIIEEITPLIEKIGIRGKVPLQDLQEFRETLEKEIEQEREEAESLARIVWKYKVSDEDREYANPYEYDTVEEFQIAVNKAKENEKNPSYAWRNTVARYCRFYADPNEYETKEEYDVAVKKAKAEQDEKEWQKREEEYLQKKNICDYCMVHIKLYENPLYYLRGGLDLSVGDKVIVPFGDEECEGWVVAIGRCYHSVLPFSFKRIRPVFKKL